MLTEAQKILEMYGNDKTPSGATKAVADIDAAMLRLNADLAALGSLRADYRARVDASPPTAAQKQEHRGAVSRKEPAHTRLIGLDPHGGRSVEEVANQAISDALHGRARSTDPMTAGSPL